jgi:hypothetical protein
MYIGCIFDQRSLAAKIYQQFSPQQFLFADINNIALDAESILPG